MLEPQRSHYLRALGIDVYVPRAILPGALASLPSVWAEPVHSEPEPIDNDAQPAISAETAAALSAAVEPIVETVRQRSLPDDLRIDLAAPAVKPAVASGGISAVRSATEINTAPKIALSVAVDSGLLIVDDAPPNTALRGEYLRLLSNVLFALQGRNSMPALDVFLWPMVKHPQLDQGAAAARETLAAHLHKQIQQHSIHTVLLLGAAAQQWCAFEQVDGRAAPNCIKSVSLLACLQAPEQKRQLWHDIRQLAAAR